MAGGGAIEPLDVCKGSVGSLWACSVSFSGADPVEKASGLFEVCKNTFLACCSDVFESATSDVPFSEGRMSLEVVDFDELECVTRSCTEEFEADVFSSDRELGCKGTLFEAVIVPLSSSICVGLPELCSGVVNDGEEVLFGPVAKGSTPGIWGKLGGVETVPNGLGLCGESWAVLVAMLIPFADVS